MQRSWKNTGFIQWEILPDVPSEKKMSYIMKTCYIGCLVLMQGSLAGIMIMMQKVIRLEKQDRDSLAE